MRRPPPQIRMLTDRPIRRQVNLSTQLMVQAHPININIQRECIAPRLAHEEVPVEIGEWW